jgi:hypothetical protein
VSTAPSEGNHLMIALPDEFGEPEAIEVVLRHVPAAAREQFPALRARAAGTMADLRPGVA